MLEQTSPCNTHTYTHTTHSAGPTPPSSSSSHPRNLCQEPHDLSHRHPLQHQPDCFDFSIDISNHPTCMHFSCLTWDSKCASTNDSCGKRGKKKKRQHNISHTVPGAPCATIMFTLCSRGWPMLTCVLADDFTGSPTQPCTSCPREDASAFREKAMKDVPLPRRSHRQGGH